MSNLRLFLLEPEVVFHARADQFAFTFPLDAVIFDSVDIGAFGDIQEGMTVTFGSSSFGSELGRQRIRKAATSDTIYIGRSSPGVRDGEVYPVDDCFITVWAERRVWAKIPFINGNGTIFKDSEIAWDEQTGDEIPPKANAGKPVAGTIGAGSVLTVDFDGTASYAQADGASISTYLWDVDDGTITVGTSASSAITATFPAGFRYISLTVTDSNGITHTVYVPVFARDPADDDTIGNYQIERRSYSKDGQTVALRILENIPESTYPDGTLVILFNEPSSASDRTNIKFAGWHHADPAAIAAGRTAILRDVVFECLDVAGKLDTLPGFPITVENKSSPTSWLHMSNASMDRYIDYILRWHSNALDLAPFTPSGTGSDYPFVILGSDAQSLWQQAARRAQALVPDYHLTCDTGGRLAVIVDPMLQETADRTSTVQAALTEADWSDVRYSRQRAPRVHWLRSEAILASATQIAALFTVAPDTTPGQGAIEQTHGEQLAKNHVDLMNAEGHRYARLNAFESYFNITLAEGDEQDIEPAALTWVTLVIGQDTAAQRNLQLSTARGLVHQVDVRYQHERTGTVKTVTLTWEKETVGTPAAPYFPPETEFPPEYDPEPDGGFDPEPEPTGAGDGFGTFYFKGGNWLARTRALSASSPEYTDQSIDSGTPGTVYDWILDPYNPTTRGFAIAQNGVWRATGLDGGTTTWAQVVSASDVQTATSETDIEFWYKIIGSINIENYFGFLVNAGESGARKLWYGETTDGGDNWSYNQVFSTSVTIRAGAGLTIVPKVVGSSYVLYAAVWTQSTPTNRFSVYRSADRGANWSLVNNALPYSGGPAGAMCLIAPYEGNESGNLVWASFRAESGTAGLTQIYKSTDGFSTFTQPLLPGVGVADTETLIKRLGIEIFTQDSNQIAIWTGTNRLFKSTDGGDNWTEITFSGYVPGTHGNVIAAGGFPYASGQYYIGTSGRYVFVSTDGGVNWVDKSGDVRDIMTSNISDHSSGGRLGVVVPVWVAE